MFMFMGIFGGGVKVYDVMCVDGMLMLVLVLFLLYLWYVCVLCC